MRIDPIAAPSMAPILQAACSDDMIGRPIRFSIDTALVFMETSMNPIKTPKIKLVQISTSKEWLNEIAANAISPSKHDQVVKNLLPYFFISGDMNDMERIAPPPMDKSAHPSSDGLSPMDSLIDGILDAHEPKVIPFMRKIMHVAHLLAFSAGSAGILPASGDSLLGILCSCNRLC